MAIGNGQSVWQCIDEEEANAAPVQVPRTAVVDSNSDEIEDEDEGECPDTSAASTAVDEMTSIISPIEVSDTGDIEGDVGSMQDDGFPIVSSADDNIAGVSAESTLPFPGDHSVGGEPLQPSYNGPRISSIPHVLVTACERLNEVAFALGRLQMDAGLDIVPSEYMRTQLNYGLLLPTYAWAVGVPFAEICNLTECPEGTIVVSLYSKSFISLDICIYFLSMPCGYYGSEPE